MAGAFSRNKGAQYERDIANYFSREFGEEVRRYGAQERWKSYSGDIRTKQRDSILHDIHWELKKHEAWSILEWYKKASDDAEPQKIPAVVCSRNREDNYVFLSLEHLVRILKELDGFRKESMSSDSGSHPVSS